MLIVVTGSGTFMITLCDSFVVGQEQSTRSSGQTSGCGISVYTDPFLVQKVSSFPLTVSSFKGVYIISSAPAGMCFPLCTWSLIIFILQCCMLQICTIFVAGCKVKNQHNVPDMLFFNFFYI